MSDAGLLDFATMRPATVEPVYPSYQRPDMNIAPAMDTANKFASAQLSLAEAKRVSDFNAKADPLKLQVLSDQAKASGPETEARITQALDAKSASERDATFRAAQASDAAASYALQQPDGPERIKAWSAAGDTMGKLGIMTPDQVQKWKATPPDQYQATADGFHTTAQVVSSYMVRNGGDVASPKQRIDAGIAAQKELSREMTQDSTLASDPAAQKARYEEILQRITGQGAPAKPPATAPAPTPTSPGWGPQGGFGALAGRMGKAFAKDVSGAWDAATGGGGSAPAAPAGGSVAADQAAHEANLKGATGKSAADAVGYTGDPKDEAAQRAWFDGLKDGDWFINPADGKPRQKKPPTTTGSE